MSRKNITVSDEAYKALSDYKADNKHRTFAEAILALAKPTMAQANNNDINKMVALISELNLLGNSLAPRPKAQLELLTELIKKGDMDKVYDIFPNLYSPSYLIPEETDVIPAKALLIILQGGIREEYQLGSRTRYRTVAYDGSIPTEEIFARGYHTSFDKYIEFQDELRSYS